ncbi:DUF2380 domain-containing protein [Paracoccus methylovorus]|uniref:DUF2380 domain-containing protein n=1 Tax=Paracoccus methylovorus TaxID=2812658 RepID=A0ABX7JFU7_9RHOB|nr:DUF2380 domain-containing protein [Paracoccus methylovorus]QRZ12283.1 DUF2380 domain-containing protein [Paracoccus methylovorus]
MRQTIYAAIAALMPLTAVAEGIALFPVKLLDTSQEVRDQTTDHERRLGILTDILYSELDGAKLIGLGSISHCQPQTTDCLLAVAQDAETTQAVFVVVQKASTLILQIFVTLVDVESGELIASRDLNFRGDNDESWRHAGMFLVGQLQSLGD